MNSFLGRAKELKLYEDRWKSSDSQLAVLYGRRRVGKTELIRHFAKNKKTIFAVGTRSDARSQKRHFLDELGRFSDDNDLARLPIDDWDTLFSRLTKALKESNGKALIVLDEFPWMVESSPELPSIIQKWWDSDWSRTGKVFLIICGSYFGFMEREVLAEKSPLFGRRTSALLLKPLPFSESRHFHKSLPLKEQVKRHLLCGGIPAYHKLFQSNESLSTQLIKSFFEPDSPLAREADFLLMEELKEPKLYFSLLEALGSSRVAMSDLALQLGVDRSRIPYYTRSLIELRYVEKLSPLLHYKDQSERKSRYRISDPLLRFWFTFVYPNTNLIQRMDASAFYATEISPKLDAYWGIALEALAADLFLKTRLARLVEPFRAGVYWDKEIQLDFVIALKSGRSYLGEVKWSKLDALTVSAYVKKMSRFNGQISYQPVMISAEEIPRALRKREDCQLFALSDLLESL